MIQQQEAKLIEQIEQGLLQVAEQEERKLDQQIRNLEDLSEFYIDLVISHDNNYLYLRWGWLWGSSSKTQVAVAKANAARTKLETTGTRNVTFVNRIRRYLKLVFLYYSY